MSEAALAFFYVETQTGLDVAIKQIAISMEARLLVANKLPASYKIVLHPERRQITFRNKIGTPFIIVDLTKNGAGLNVTARAA